MTTPQCRTLRDLAALARVSHVTVSLALRNHPRIPVATCRRIQALAEKHGYRQNPFVAAQMAAVRTHHPPAYQATLAVLTDRAARDGFERNEVLMRYVAGARARAERLGYKIEVFRIGPGGLAGARLSQVLISRNIPGVMVPPLSFYDGPLDLDWTRFAAAAIGYYQVGKLPFHVVYYDTFQAILNIGRELRRLGYVRPGLALKAQDDLLNHELWSAGFRHWQQTLPARDRVPLLVTDEWNREAVLRWYRRHRPDVVIGVRDDVPRWLEQAGVKIPRDVGYANAVLTEKLRHQAGYYQNFESIAAGAIDLIVEQIQRNDRGWSPDPKTLLVQGWWMPGDTLRAGKISGQSVRQPPALAVARTRGGST